MHDNNNNGNEIAYASFTVSDFCVRIKSGFDESLCGINNQNADDWAGSELKVGTGFLIPWSMPWIAWTRFNDLEFYGPPTPAGNGRCGFN